MSWNCQGISHCPESGHPVTIIYVGIVYIVEKLNKKLRKKIELDRWTDIL